jgi:hypothetical protein
MDLCALGNVIGRTCREYGAGAAHHVRNELLLWVIKGLGRTLDQAAFSSLLLPQERTLSRAVHEKRKHGLALDQR